MSDSPLLSCQEAAARLDDYVDRELSPEELGEVEAHLQVCARCAPVFRFQEGVLRRLQETIGRIQAPDGLLEQVMTRLRSEAAGQVGKSDPPKGAP